MATTPPDRSRPVADVLNLVATRLLCGLFGHVQQPGGRGRCLACGLDVPLCDGRWDGGPETF